MSNVVDFRPRKSVAPEELVNGVKADSFPSDADKAFAAIVDHLRSAASIAASLADTDFLLVTELAAKLDMETDDDIAVDLLVTLVEWEDEEREMYR